MYKYPRLDSLPMLEGSVPFSREFHRIYRELSPDSSPIDDGRPPLRLVEEICRYVSELSPPMLDGIEPLNEYKSLRLRNCSFDSRPIVDGRGPDRVTKLLRPR
jgi:hypothetical protein